MSTNPSSPASASTVSLSSISSTGLLLEESLRLEFRQGRVERAEPHQNTGWRTLPTFVILEVGKGEWYFRLKPKSRGSIPPGHAIVVPPGTRHLIGMGGGDGSIRWSHFLVSVLGAVGLGELYDFPVLLPPPESTALGDAIAHYCRLERDSRPDPLAAAVHRSAAKLHLLKCLLATGRRKERFGKVLEATHRLHPVLTYIRDHLGEDLDRASLAQRVNLSENHFHTVFKSAMGMAPMRYIQAQRLQAAQAMLSSRSHSVKEAADALGFFDAFHFSRQFKKAFGVSPRDFRRETGKFLA